MGKDSLEYISQEYLVTKTIEITKIVRNAIIYLLMFVEEEETKKEQESSEKIIVSNAMNIPDNLKNLKSKNYPLHF